MTRIAYGSSSQRAPMSYSPNLLPWKVVMIVAGQKQQLQMTKWLLQCEEVAISCVE